MLNAQREANGIPGGLVEDSYLSEGCKQRVTIYREANGQYPHEEQPGVAGYTPAGAEAAAQSDLGFAIRPPWAPGRNPWWEDAVPASSPAVADAIAHPAPLHITDLFDPAKTVAWYGEGLFSHDLAPVCMGTSGQRTFSTPSFFAFPDEPGEKLAPLVHAAEIPWTPQMAIGIPRETVTGPNFVLWPEDTDATITSATLTDAKGQSFPADPVSPSMPAPPSPPGWPEVKTVGEYSGGASFLIVPSPLPPSTAFTLAVGWTSPSSGATYGQTIHFTTTAQTRSASSRLSLHVAHSGRLLIATRAKALIGRSARLLVTPCRLIPDAHECYGTKRVYYRRAVRLTGLRTPVTIPHLAADGEVNISIFVAPFLAGDTKYSAGRDICHPAACAG